MFLCVTVGIAKYCQNIMACHFSPISIEAIFQPSGQNKFSHKKLSGWRHWGESVTTHLYEETFLNVDVCVKRLARSDLHYEVLVSSVCLRCVCLDVARICILLLLTSHFRTRCLIYRNGIEPYVT